jgi:hypothetical protein
MITKRLSLNESLLTIPVGKSYCYQVALQQSLLPLQIYVGNKRNILIKVTNHFWHHYPKVKIPAASRGVFTLLLNKNGEPQTVARFCKVSALRASNVRSAATLAYMPCRLSMECVKIRCM